jgi:hypothetical protein
MEAIETISDASRSFEAVFHVHNVTKIDRIRRT